MTHLLDQGEIWIDKEKVEHRIEDMDGRYASNTYNYLKRSHKQIAQQYLLHLMDLRGPEGEMASEAFEQAIEVEIDKITQAPFLWLLDKPLMKALARRVLADRISKGWPNPLPEPLDPNYPDPLVYTPEAFRVKPGAETDEATYGPQPDDEHRTFVVMLNDYDSPSTIAGVFVGNRLAAYRLANELDRYNPHVLSEVVEWDDTAVAQPRGRVSGQMRVYRHPWSEVRYRTHINLTSGEVVLDQAPLVEVVIDRDPRIRTGRDMVGGRGDYRAEITTWGPDYDVEQVRSTHAVLVNQVINSVKKGQI